MTTASATAYPRFYSMGTIEHFDETEQAVKEMARVPAVRNRGYLLATVAIRPPC